jgi:hypothetical protein
MRAVPSKLLLLALLVSVSSLIEFVARTGDLREELESLAEPELLMRALV